MRKHETIASQQNGDDNNERQQQVEALYFKSENYNHIVDSALADRRLLFSDGERIAQGVAKHLPHYDGSLADEPFQEWATAIIQPAVERVSQFYAILDKYKRFIRSAIRSGLGLSGEEKHFFGDEQTLIEDIFQEVTWLIFGMLDSLLEPGTAKLSTRLYALAQKHTLDYHTKKLRRRLDLGELWGRQSILGCEMLSTLELASMAAEVMEEEE